jgi:hypothetical protein
MTTTTTIDHETDDCVLGMVNRRVSSSDTCARVQLTHAHDGPPAMCAQLQQQVGTLSAIMELLTSHSVSADIAQAGAIFFKNIVSKYWRAPRPSMDERRFVIADAEKAFIYGTLVPTLPSCAAPVRCVLSLVMHETASARA